jgi:hypothetical protein
MSNESFVKPFSRLCRKTIKIIEKFKESSLVLGRLEVKWNKQDNLKEIKHKLPIKMD